MDPQENDQDFVFFSPSFAFVGEFIDDFLSLFLFFRLPFLLKFLKNATTLSRWSVWLDIAAPSINTMISISTKFLNIVEDFGLIYSIAPAMSGTILELIEGHAVYWKVYAALSSSS